MGHHHAAILAKLATKQDSCRRLPFCDPPIPGESLVGLLARNVAKHGIDRVAPVLKVAGIDTLIPDTIATTHCDSVKEIAALLSTTPEEIAARCHRDVDVPGRPDSFFEWFGTPIRSAYREVNRRRVSPLSLRTSPHHRAVWDLRVFSFCPDSRETLISDCPACGKGLGWRWTLGIAYCEHCGADLREHPQPRIEVTDIDADALDFVVDLVHPDPERKARARSAIPPALVPLGLDNGELFEFTIGVACAITTEPDSPRAIMRRVKTLDDFAKLTPAVLAQAGRVILGWPDGFHALADGMRAKADLRVGYWGKKKELGPALWLARDAYLAPAIKQELHARIDDNMAKAGVLLRRAEQRAADAVVNIGRAAEEFDIDLRVLSRWAKNGLVWSERNTEARMSIILVNRAEIAAIARQREDRIGARDLKVRLGIDPLAIEDLVQAGFVRRHDGAVADITKGVSYSRASVETFLASVMAQARPAAKGKEGVRLSKAVKRAAVERAPWLDIFQAIIDGRLRVHVHPAPDNLALTTSLVVADAADIAPFVAGSPRADAVGAGLDRMNTHEAAAFLMCTEPALADFIKSGILPTNGSIMWKLDQAAVEAFRRDFILCNEISHRCKWGYRFVRPRLADRCVEPVHNADRNKHLVWVRADVEAVIADIIQQGGKR
ncbi:hypothetical protein [Methylosinus sporium]|uniref:hypothetical protein n=1 Tax=Methylosinus sporium TaxID=428 RepID=UPI00383BF192